MSVIVCLAAVILAVAMIKWLGVLPRILQLGKTATNALVMLSASGLCDREKELAARRASVQLFCGGALLLLLCLAAFVPSGLLLVLLVGLRLLTMAEIADSLFSYQLLLIAVAFLLVGWVYRKWMTSRT